MMKQQKSNSMLTVLGAALILAALFMPALMLVERSEMYQLELSEISDGVYAYRETVTSSIPANNYTMVTLCDMGGNIYTIKGTVRVINSDTITPYAVWEKFSLVNSDEVTLYVPTGTVQYMGAFSVSRK